MLKEIPIDNGKTVLLNIDTIVYAHEARCKDGSLRVEVFTVKDDYVFDMSLDEFKKVVGLTESEG